MIASDPQIDLSRRLGLNGLAAVSAAAMPLLLCLALAGCASPGVPRPPSLHLPELVQKLTASRVDGAVTLRFAVPTQATDGSALKGPVKASLCRSAGTAKCLPTQSFPVPRGVSGQVEWTDLLPPELATGSPQLLGYRVELANTAGRSAGYSAPVLVAGGAAPGPVEGLRANGARGGIVLRWTQNREASGDVMLRRELVGGPAKGSAAGEPASRQKATLPSLPGQAGRGAQPPDAMLLRASEKSGEDRGGTVDATAISGVTYRYVALRTRTVTIDGTALEMRSVDSAPVTYTLRDIYPPTVPVGLVAADFSLEDGTGAAVDLLWQPNTELDLAGYNVYRQPLTAEGAIAGPPEKLNAQVVALPAFHDARVARGMRFRYTVTAVDQSGNASASSQAADVATAP